MSSSNGSQSTAIGSRGVPAKRKIRVSGAAPAVMKGVPSVGKFAHLHYDPKTGRRIKRGRA